MRRRQGLSLDRSSAKSYNAFSLNRVLAAGALGSQPAFPAPAKPAGWLAYPRLRRLLIGALKPAFLGAGALAALLLRLLEPWRRIRVGLIPYERIGHLAINTERFLRASARTPDAKVSAILVSGPPANEQLLKMIARRTQVVSSRWALRFYAHGLQPFIAGGRFDLDLPFNGNEYADMAGAGPQLSFTPEEHERGRRLLRRMGIPEGAAFFCFHSRDKAYLDNRHAYCSREQWAYHDYRDCDVANYLPAAEGLAARGLYALRMGSVVEAPLPREAPRVIDYATRFRDDFGDAYLLAHCKFMLGNTAGVACVPPIFNVPVALANFAPLGYGPWRAGDLFLPKTYRDSQGRAIPFRRIVDLGASMWTRSDQFENADIAVVQNTAEDITGLAEEMDARLDNRWTPAAEDEDLQQCFRAVFPPAHPITGFPARVGALFLRRHRDLLEA